LGLVDKPLQIESEYGVDRFAYGMGSARFLRARPNDDKILYTGEAEYHISGEDSVTQRIYVRANGYSPIVKVEKKAVEWTYGYYLQDHLGTPLVEMDDEAQPISIRRHGPWGNVVSANGSQQPMEDSERSFTGHEPIASANLLHMNGRVYDPDLSQFLSPDVFMRAPSPILGLNRYAYVSNTPLNGTDPSGWVVPWDTPSIRNFPIHESTARQLRYTLESANRESRAYLQSQAAYTGVLYRAERRLPHSVLEQGSLPYVFRGLGAGGETSVRDLLHQATDFNVFDASRRSGRAAGPTPLLDTSFDAADMSDLAANFGWMLQDTTRSGFVYEIDPGNAGLVSYGAILDRAAEFCPRQYRRIERAINDYFALDPNEVGIFGPVLGSDIRAVHVFVSTDLKNQLVERFRQMVPTLTEVQLQEFSLHIENNPIRVDAARIRNGSFANQDAILNHAVGEYTRIGGRRFGVRVDM